VAIATATIDQAGLAMSAVFVNRFLISAVGGAYVRIAFAEAAAPDLTAFRAATMMTAADARELAFSILNVLGAAPSQPS
jgi:hypothetical protein